MAIGSDGIGLDRRSTTTSWRETIGVDRARADPVRGRADGGLGRDPAGAAAGDRRSRSRARSITAVDHRLRGVVAVRLLDARGPAARLDRRLDRRRRGLRAAARVDAAARGWRARWRARPASTTRSRCCSCSGSSTGSSSPDYGAGRHVGLFAQQLGDRARGRAGGRLARGAGRSGACGWRRPGCTRSPRWRPPRWRSAPPTRSAARASSPSTSPGLALGSATIPAKRTVTAFHEGLAWVAPARRCSSCSACSSSRASSATSRWRARCSRSWWCSSRGRWRRSLATRRQRLRARERVVLGWAGLRGAVPVVLATFPVIEGVPQSLEFFNIVFFAVLLSTLLQGSTFEPLARRLGVTTDEPALPRPLAEVGDDPPARRRGRRVPGRPGRRDRRACACATSGCRATRSST